MKTVVIEMRGGVIQEIYSESNDVRIVIFDWDEELEPNGEKAKECRTLKDSRAMSPSLKEQVDTAMMVC